MDQDIEIINTNTRNEKIKNFFIKNKKSLFSSVIILLVILFSFLFYEKYKLGQKEKLANKFNLATINFEANDKGSAASSLKEIIKAKDKTYSPLALYFLLDNNIIKSQDKINNLFDVLIDETQLDKEIKNLIIFKKALYNSDFAKENDLLKILNPIINSDSIWKSHSLYLLGEYFLSKNEKKKAKEFFEKILIVENANSKIKLEAKRRIERDLGE